MLADIANEKFNPSEASPPPPFLSVVVPAHCSASIIQPFLQSLTQANIGRYYVELIIVDDASPDPVRPIFDAVLDKLNKTFVNVELIENIVNRGRAKTRNIGLKKAQGEYVLFLDCDGLLDAFYLHLLIERIQKNPPCAIRGNRRVKGDLVRKSAYLSYFDSRFIGARLDKISSSFDLNRLPPKFFATGEIAVPRGILNKIGGFDEDFAQYGCEDEEMGWRLESLGLNLVFAPELLVIDIDENATLDRACRRMEVYASESLPILLNKHPPATRFAPIPFLENGTRISWIVIKLSSLCRSIVSGLRNIILFALLKLDKSPPSTRPPTYLYTFCLGLSYLVGVSLRKRFKVISLSDDLTQ